MKTRDEIVFLLLAAITRCSTTIACRTISRHISTVNSAPRAGPLLANFFEALNAELGYADYLDALQHYRLSAIMSAFPGDYPFADRLHPGLLDVIEHPSA
jgi:hypothetical protein